VFPRLEPSDLEKVVKALKITVEEGRPPRLDKYYQRKDGKKYGPYYRLRWDGRTLYLGKNERLVDWFRTFLDLANDPMETARRALEEDDPTEVAKRAETLALLESDAWREVAELREEVRRLRDKLEELEKISERVEQLEERLQQVEERVEELETEGLLDKLRKLLRL